MKRVIAAAITLLCVACGGSSEDSAGADAPNARSAQASRPENAAPEIVSASIEPATAGASDPLSVQVVAKDPDRDRVRLTIEWYRNGDLVSGVEDATVPGGTFARGDRVYAIAYASDGKDEVSSQTAPIVLGNSAPTVRRVVISPARPTSLDMLQIEPDIKDEDGDRLEVSYRWLRNGQPIPDNDGPRLPPGVGHRAEQIVVQVKASDGTDESEWVSSAPVTLANAPPAITTKPNYTLSGEAQYSYEVAAEDPDGDRPLKYELLQGPRGMSVDIVSGRVTWRVPDTAKGAFPIEVAVSDPYGGRTTQRYSIAVGWEDAPASPADGAKPDAKAAPKAKVSTAAPQSAAESEERDEDYTDEDQDEEAASEEF